MGRFELITSFLNVWFLVAFWLPIVIPLWKLASDKLAQIFPWLSGYAALVAAE